MAQPVRNRLQCFKVTPYASGGDLFLNVEQIIPTPESRDFMVGMAVKEAEEKSVSDELRDSQRLRLRFWDQALEKIKHSECSLYDNINPGKDHWLSAPTGISSVSYALIFAKKEIRVELTFQRADADENTFMFEFMKDERT